MTPRLWFACLVVTCAFCFFADRAEAYPGGGDPNAVFSCYGDCGGRSPTVGGPVRCYCDEQCNARGDCCADRNEFCPAAVARPACSLTSPTSFQRFCGTDLGFVYEHNGVLQVLFGDSWEWPASNPNRTPLVIPENPGFAADECFDRGISGVSDDARGSMSKMRPLTSSGIPQRAANLPALPTGATCSSVLSLEMDSTNPTTFKAIRLFEGSSERPMPPAYTPLAGFSDGTSEYGVFSARNPSNPTAFYVYVGKRGSNGNYSVIKDLGTASKFLSPSVARVTSLTDFTTPTGPATPGTMLMFGRPRFMTSGNQSVATNGLYLLKQSLPLASSSSWMPEYYKELDGTGAPVWTMNEAEAMPIFTDDFKVTGQIDIKWVPEIGKWLMLYGGDIEWYFLPDANDQPRHGAIHMRMADYPWGPWTRATPLLWREDVGKFIKCDASDRTNPIGCDQRQDAPAQPYHPGDFIAGRPSSTVNQCRIDLPQPVQPNPCPTLVTPLVRHQHGELYAANLIPTWTLPGAIELASLLKTTTIYFTVSTWMPYQVLIAAADLKLPNFQYGQFKVQLRDLNNQMIAMDSTFVSITAGVPATHWLPIPVDPAAANRGPRLGDIVYFNGTDSVGQTRRIARSGHNIVFPVASGGLTTSQQWRLDPVDQPVNTPIVLGKTKFQLVSVSSANPVRRLKSKTEGLRAYDGGGTTAHWTFTNACLASDFCPLR